MKTRQPNKIIDHLIKFAVGTCLPLSAIPTLFLTHSCANTTQAPSGGDKDTIPPLITNITPLPGTINLKPNTKHIVFSFNEFIKIKNPKSAYLSPPTPKAPKLRLRGKHLIVEFESQLRDKSTYCLSLNDAITDNNEGNLFPGYDLIFSTSENIDSMMITGLVQDCNSLKPIKGATVMLYKDHSDSAIFKSLPDAACKTDDWGFFCLRNIQDTLYRLYAIEDNNNNNIYDPDSERVAFYDSLIRPSIKVNDSIAELKQYNPKDTAKCLARKVEYELNLFKEKASKQLITKYVRKDLRSAYLCFMAPNAKIDSLWIEGLAPQRIIQQFNIEKDSLELWLNDQRDIIPDTLNLFIKYDKTDSTGKLKSFTEQLKLAEEGLSTSNKRKSKYKKIKKEDTLCIYTNLSKPENFERQGFELEFKYPLIKADLEKIEFSYINPKQKESKGGFSCFRSKNNIRKYSFIPKLKTIQQSYEYLLKFPKRTFRDINGFYNDSSSIKLSLPTNDKLSSLKLNIKKGEGESHYIIHLLNEQRDKILSGYNIDRDSTIFFPYLSEGKYSIRVTEDKNNNTIVDSGNLLLHQQAEKVRFYKVNNNLQIKVIPSSELEYNIDLQELFK